MRTGHGHRGWVHPRNTRYLSASDETFLLLAEKPLLRSHRFVSPAATTTNRQQANLLQLKKKLGPNRISSLSLVAATCRKRDQSVLSNCRHQWSFVSRRIRYRTDFELSFPFRGTRVGSSEAVPSLTASRDLSDHFRLADLNRVSHAHTPEWQNYTNNVNYKRTMYIQTLIQSTYETHHAEFLPSVLSFQSHRSIKINWRYWLLKTPKHRLSTTRICPSLDLPV